MIATVQTVGECDIAKCVEMYNNVREEIANGCKTKDFKSVINMHNTSIFSFFFEMHRKARGNEYRV